MSRPTPEVCPHGKPYLDEPSEAEKCVVPCECGHPCDDHQPWMAECWGHVPSGLQGPVAVCLCSCEAFKATTPAEAAT